MKKAFFSLAILMSALHLPGQGNLPTYGYNYQAVIRDNNSTGAPAVANQPVVLRFLVQNAANQTLYEETHSDTTDNFGRVASVVGAGVPVSGNFDTLNWAAEKHYLKVRVKIGVGMEVDLGDKEEIVQPPLAKGSGNWLLNGQNIYRLEGKVGIGTTNPATTLTIASDNSSPNVASQLGVQPLSDPKSRLYLGYHPIKNYASIQALTEGVVYRPLLLNPDGGNVGIATTNPQVKLDVNGDARVKTLTILGNDRTHLLNTTDGRPIPAFTVVVFDETQPGKIRPCTTAYDRKVAGVVSNTDPEGKHRPGIIHAQENTTGGSPVAIDGTVEVLAVGPVAVGDLLSSSAVPGHAMAITDPLRSIGCTIGKAMTPLAEGEKGKVEMWVERH